MRAHKCTPLCGIEAPDINVETIYTDETATEGYIWQSLGYHRGLEVIPAVPNPDAPPPDKLPQGMTQDVIQSSSKPLTKAWLVSWR
jgi:hypothetical protein